MKIYLIDNFDSFTYNLVHLLREEGVNDVTVVRNNKISAEEARKHDAVLISPGPGIPKDAGRLMAVLGEIKEELPILGVCLGMQALGELFGGKLDNLSEVFHGVATPIQIQDKSHLFQGFKDETTVGRYHSWVVAADSLPEELLPTAHDANGQVMALRHKNLPIYGLQFHPESVLTPEGGTMFRNFIQQVANLQALNRTK